MAAKTITVENTADRVHLVADFKIRATPLITTPGSPPPPADALMPGMNEVIEEEWLKAEKHPLVQFYIETGVFRVIRRPADSLNALEPREALDVVKRTFDRTLLEKWFDSEKRKAIRDAIEVQLATIKLPAAKPQE